MIQHSAEVVEHNNVFYLLHRGTRRCDSHEEQHPAERRGGKPAVARFPRGRRLVAPTLLRPLHTKVKTTTLGTELCGEWIEISQSQGGDEIVVFAVDVCIVALGRFGSGGRSPMLS
jgi:hypothetical protein